MKPTVLIYCQHSMGMGHLVRSLAVAGALAKRFSVVFLNGGPVPHGVRVPHGVAVVHLPPVAQSPQGELVSLEEGRAVEDALDERRRRILNIFYDQRPGVVCIELFPFGRKKFAGELLPLLEAAHGTTPRPVIVCSLRDILMANRKDQQKHDDRAAELANRYFDAILVHADPRFARLEETFRPRVPLEIPVHYSGFVVAGSSKAPSHSPASASGGGILVSAGGGRYGMPLFRRVVEAFPRLWEAFHLPVRIVTGPFLAEEEYRELAERANAYPALAVQRFTADLHREMQGARVSISQCGYNTTLDILRSGVSALVVPFAAGRESEQRMRARRLEALGLVRVLEEHELSPQMLAAAVEQTLQFTPAPMALNLHGEEKTVEIIDDMVGNLSRRSSASRSNGKAVSDGWLAPVKQALDASREEVLFFFRDDDVGWENPRLLALLDLFRRYRLPIDLAVIPQALTGELAGELIRRKEAAPEEIGLHQHGFTHKNHEPTGRKCEFGASRSFIRQLNDIFLGRHLLEKFLHPHLDPIFTPPWNRCTVDTGRVLVELGFKMLSRDVSARPLRVRRLKELPIQVDWFKKRKQRLSREQIGEMLGERIRAGAPVGIMLHHAWMDAAELSALETLLQLLAEHPQARCLPMRRLLRKPRGSNPITARTERPEEERRV